MDLHCLQEVQQKWQRTFSLVKYLDKSKVSLIVMLGNDQKNEISREIIVLYPQRDMLHIFFINNYLHIESHGFSVLVIVEDNSRVLLQQGEMFWSREDDLIEMISVE
jgi:hypothetical protein